MGVGKGDKKSSFKLPNPHKHNTMRIPPREERVEKVRFGKNIPQPISGKVKKPKVDL
jgi:hypothetical protein